LEIFTQTQYYSPANQYFLKQAAEQHQQPLWKPALIGQISRQSKETSQTNYQNPLVWLVS